MGGALYPALAADLSAADLSAAVWRSRDGHRVRAARAADACALAPELRPEDEAEIRAASGLAPEAALRRALIASELAFAIEHRDAAPDAAPMALFGVADHPLGREVGAPWLLGHRDLPRIAGALLREAPLWIEQLGAGRWMLSNCADARNALHLRWLSRLGFQQIRAIERHGAEARRFIEFVKVLDPTGRAFQEMENSDV